MTQRFYAALIFTGALLVIASAWGFELIGGYQPCGLCLEQRIPYYIGVPIAGVALFMSLKNRAVGLIRVTLLLVAVIFAASTALAVRHAGVEWGWWLGPSNCGAGGFETLQSAGSLLESLKIVKIAYCDQAALRIFGLSFAGWNAVASIALVALAVKAAFVKS